MHEVKSIQGHLNMSRPDMVTTTGSSDFNTFGTRSETPFEQAPSKAVISNAGSRSERGAIKGNSIVLAQGNNTAYIYNGKGIQATFPLSSFVTLGIKK